MSHSVKSSFLCRMAHRGIVIWLLTGCVLIYMMVLLGGITRLTGSGLSMVEWTPTGSLPPMSNEAWISEFEKYMLSPEFKKINNHFDVEDFKQIFWWEYTHRMLGRTLGFVFIIPFCFFAYKNKFPNGYYKKIFILLLMGAFQGALGWFMVKSGLVHNPHVSHYRLAAHLTTALITFGYALWLALGLAFPKNEYPAQSLKKSSIVLLIVVFLQIVYGAFVAGLKAGYAYNTFPKMDGQWIPGGINAMSPIWLNYLEGWPGVQFVHRCLALIVVCITGVIFLQARNITLSLRRKKIINLLGVLVLIQFTLGVFTVLLKVPLLIALLHQTGAFLLVSNILLLIHATRGLSEGQGNAKYEHSAQE